MPLLREYLRKVQFLGLLPAVHGDGAQVCGRMTSQVQFLGLVWMAEHP